MDDFFSFVSISFSSFHLLLFTPRSTNSQIQSPPPPHTHTYLDGHRVTHSIYLPALHHWYHSIPRGNMRVMTSEDYNPSLMSAEEKHTHIPTHTSTVIGCKYGVTARAMPKSAIFKFPSLLRSKFCGFRSLLFSTCRMETHVQGRSN